MSDAKIGAHNKNAENRLDKELLTRVTRGDRDALHDLYGRYYHPLLRFTYRMTGNLQEAQECINDVMLVVWQKSGSFNGNSKVSTWIMGIAYHKALKKIKKSAQWRDRFKATEWSESIEPSKAFDGLTDESDLGDLLQHGMKTLSAKHRAVVELTYFYGYSYDEIAAIMECPVNTVKTRMFHARARLKDVLPKIGRDDIEA